MLAVVQFPIADARLFCGIERSLRPAWGSLAEGSDFVPGFGRARVRAEFEAVPRAWRDEAQYVSARWALRTRGVPERIDLAGIGAAAARRQPFWVYRPAKPATEFRFVPAFRRLLSDGIACSRVDVGFWVLGKGAVGDTDVLGLVHDLLEIETEVRDLGRGANGHAERRALRRQGASLARLLYQSTSKRPHQGDAWPEKPPTIRASVPAVFVDDRMGLGQMPKAPPWFQPAAAHLGTPQIASFPQRASLVAREATGDLELAYTSLESSGMRYGVWLMRGSKQANGSEPVPGLRQCLLRLHAMRQVLRELQGLAATGLIPSEASDGQSDPFGKYLQQIVGQVLRPTMYGANQEELRKIVSLYDLGNRAERDRLELMVDRLPLERQIKARVRKATSIAPGSNVTIYQVETMNMSTTGPTTQITQSGSGTITIHELTQVAGDYLRTSKQIAEDTQQESLKRALDELRSQVEALAKKTPDSDAQEAAARKLKQLTEEAAAAKPDHDMLKVTGKGLVEAAKTVAEMVGPVTTAVTGVLALFGLAL